MKAKAKRPKAAWTRAFPDQAAKLNPERTRAGGVKARSASEQARMAVYRPLAALFLNAHDYCQRCIQSNRATRSAEVHHLRGRAGLLLFDVRHWAALCSKCHSWVHTHPEAARRAGWLCERGLWNQEDSPNSTKPQ